MNERIRELAEQSGATVLTTHGMEDVVDGCYVIGPARLEKFAKLIVKEAGEYLMRPEFIGRSDLDWSMVLNEHFGVQE